MATTHSPSATPNAAGGHRDDNALALMFLHLTDALESPLTQGNGHAAPAHATHAPPAYHPLPQTRTAAGAACRLPAPTAAGKVTAESPAIEVMTDLHHVAPLTISAGATADEANDTMVAGGVRSLFVVDGGRAVVGIVTSVDLLGEKPVLVAQQRGLHHTDVLVQDIMTPAGRLEGIALPDVLAARVGDVVATLRHSGRQHALVLDPADPHDPATRTVRGIFSLTQIARQLGVALPTGDAQVVYGRVN